MTTWAQFRADVKTAIAALVPASQVVWKGREQPFHKPNQVIVILNMQTSKGYGLTESRLIQDPDIPDNLLESLLGWRKATVSVRCETNRQTDDGVAWNAAELIATRLKSFNDQSSLNTVLDLNDLEYEIDDRAVSVVLFDTFWNVLITDTRPGTIGTFDHIELTSHVKDTDGAELPIPPNYVDLLIPVDGNVNTLVSGSDTLLDGSNVLTV